MPTNKIKVQEGNENLGYGPGWAGIKIDTTDKTIQYNVDGTLRTVAVTGAQTVAGTQTFSGSIKPAGGIAYTGLTMGSGVHPISFEGVTLAATTNCIRGASVNPTRLSGWTSFSGTISTTPAQCYTDYRELHTTGVAEVLGAGFFPYMDASASCASLFGIQSIAYVSAGATVLTASAAAGTGVYSIWAKTVLDGETFNSGAQAGGMFLSVQANVTDVVAAASCVQYLEVASGGVKDVFYLKAGSTNYATNFFTLSAECAGGPVTTWGADAANCAGAPTKGMRVRVGTTEYWIPLYVNT